ncbi:MULTISPECIES: helix-turn-helix transcriptional regulator [Xanthomonas]|uniref:HTH-type transcriptional regulator ImmR n=1 Tax=Xanthomonas sacchari TaxID=56458 RepID=A0ABT3DUK9_9XANT|nr:MULTISPECIES: helix-turn-helix transcriptional regulator [Xanthomonas]MCW0367847.1 HTH-type transcriptional regulator ImmR [Xanthomonas sacchari]MCW0369897.1 HTH-type transcriptional regulator ImmR [Xanthomonas sacchari]MCW0374150.1 HTH-type transcriptional regulator ImmR [Xanthomonas sacchari]MCW0377789.1 HTH-type transcriptional regulator ImmR [Xanthomonas sacchari]MCW0387745.1 HTH-type transcriptional regulator ImmR [Xanthomonas sacchari]
MDIGVRLMQARRNAGFTLRELAALLGVAHSTLGHWENNRSVPNARHLLKIAELTGVDAYVLLTGKPSKLNQTDSDSLPLPVGKRMA